MSSYQLSLLTGRAERRLPAWDRDIGRPRVLPLWRAVILLCFLLRHDRCRRWLASLSDVSQLTVSQ
ncbi:hypothetical protein D7231_33600 [Streptomyces klenkii]|uniref:Uncharacterized protein n=1 Tax=Streptomyces klenkii TaxID=1420899 RepID=A0A3B0AIJ2_9ACTN|nr:hypothetical protein D7231_33600 [Streptomyces klenkii]